jgi:serine/threonine-protein kinase
VLAPGFAVTTNVRLVRKLGQGGMGSVWIADHQGLRAQVAVKFISPEHARNDAVLARFAREASAAASVKSPHIVQVFDHGLTEPDKVPFIVMELLDGHDVRQLIERQGPMALDVVSKIMAQAGRALTKAHAAGVIHRDIKPDNLFVLDVDGEPFVKLLDFGVAKQTEDGGFAMTSTGATVGTPYYMSPEQMLNAKGVDSRSDLWSLAVVAYHALTGRVPFDADTIGALCIAIDRATFVPPSALRLGLPSAVDSWFGRALARDPDQRFSSARDMTDSFAAAVRGASTEELSMANTAVAHSAPGLESPRTPSLGVASVVRNEGTSVGGRSTIGGRAGAAMVVVLLLASTAGAVLLFRNRSDDANKRVAVEPTSSSGSAAPPTQGTPPTVAPVTSVSASPQPAPVPVAGPAQQAKAEKRPTVSKPEGAQPPAPPPAAPPPPADDPFVGGRHR